MPQNEQFEEEPKLIPGSEFPKEAFRRTVTEFTPPDNVNSAQSVSSVFTFQVASFGEAIAPWGSNVRQRDIELRAFWKSEDMLAGAVWSVCARNAAFTWKIEGEEKTAEVVTNMLQNAITGQIYGWVPFITALSLDLYTQDNGAFIEIIRQKNKPDSPVVGIAHLDAGKCTRTGNPKTPVIYTDKKGIDRKMNWWSVIPLSEFPSAEQRMNGVGICAVSRVLRLASILKNIAVFKNEKVSGRFIKAIHFVGGVSKQEITDIMDRGQENADNAGQTRYMLPQIIASLDPEKPVSTASIDLASLPDNFDLDTELKWYITGLSLGFGVDYQDFAPLPGGGIGSSNQSETLHRKSRGKSPAVFMRTLENTFKFYGVMPQSVAFKFDDSDIALQLEDQKLSKTRAEERGIRIRGGEITPNVARQIALRQGDLTQEEFDAIPEDYVGVITEEDFSFSNELDDNFADAVGAGGKLNQRVEKPRDQSKKVNWLARKVGETRARIETILKNRGQEELVRNLQDKVEKFENAENS